MAIINNPMDVPIICLYPNPSKLPIPIKSAKRDIDKTILPITIIGKLHFSINITVGSVSVLFYPKLGAFLIPWISTLTEMKNRMNEFICNTMLPPIPLLRVFHIHSCLASIGTTARKVINTFEVCPY
jgi:hypothetical protein